MTETPSTAAKTLKIVLWIVLGTAGLCALCCGAVFLFSKDARDTVSVALRMIDFGKAMQQRYGAGAQISLTERNDGGGREMIFAVGLPAFDPERVAEEQDALWKLFAESFREGAPPVTHFAVGVPAAGSSKVKWEAEHKVAVEELVRRTGVAAPPWLLFDRTAPEAVEDEPPLEAPK